MLEKRQQGRPKHGESQVGRDRIIAGIVEMVRSGSHGDMSRKEIAQYVGITPALITYYFPKGQLLLIDSIADVFATSYEELDAILSGAADYEERLTAAFRMILAFYKREYHVELLYADLCRKGILNDSVVERMKLRLARFLAQDPTLSGAEIATPEIRANVIWGACAQCARLNHAHAIDEIVGRFAGSRSPADASERKRARSKRKASYRDEQQGVRTSVQRQSRFPSRPADARGEASAAS